MIATLLFVVFVVLLVFDVPIAICLGTSSVATLLAKNLPLDMIPTNVFAATGKFVLLAIPFFVLAGNIMEKTGISTKLVNLAQALIGHKKGGLPFVCVLVSCFFAAISGSGPATVAALGSVIVPMMVSAGYDTAFTCALMAISGAIGVIIPPSTSMVVYSSVSGASVGRMFLGGIIPGLMMGLALAIVFTIATRKDNIKLVPKSTGKQRIRAFKESIWGLMMPVIILGGIYGGIFTPTEAAAVSAVYGLFVGTFIYRSLTIKEFYKILIDSAAQSGVVMFLIACASLFAWVINVAGVGSAVQNAILTFADGNLFIFLIIVNITLLIAGCFIDVVSSFYIFTPIFLPIAIKLGYDPIALGIVMTVNTSIGLVTPPVGANLYVACSIGQVGVKDVSKKVWGLVFGAVIVLLIITYFPEIIMLIPNMYSS
jgi:tripartite ATP-independent transporter DctM subunit